MSYLGWDGWHLQLGDISSWIGSLLTGGGLFIAAQTWRAQQKDKSTLQSERLAQADRERQAQARLVQSACEDLRAGFDPHGESYELVCTIMVLNRSDEPIRNVVVNVKVEGGDPSYSFDPPGGHTEKIGTLASIDYRFDAAWHVATPGLSAPGGLNTAGWQLAITIDFVDRNGVAWRVDDEGVLTERHIGT